LAGFFNPILIASFALYGSFGVKFAYRIRNMTIKIEIQESQVKHLREFYDRRLDEINTSIRQLEKELHEINQAIIQLDTISTNKETQTKLKQ
jgi:hypothetical protein